MKTLLLILTVFLLSCSCGKQRAYTVHTAYGSGWNRSSTYIKCDSVKLIDAKHARVFKDGTATDLYAEEILISGNEW